MHLKIFLDWRRRTRSLRKKLQNWEKISKRKRKKLSFSKETKIVSKMKLSSLRTASISLKANARN